MSFSLRNAVRGDLAANAARLLLLAALAVVPATPRMSFAAAVQVSPEEPARATEDNELATKDEETLSPRVEQETRHTGAPFDETLPESSTAADATALELPGAQPASTSLDKAKPGLATEDLLTTLGLVLGAFVAMAALVIAILRGQRIRRRARLGAAEATPPLVTEDMLTATGGDQSPAVAPARETAVAGPGEPATGAVVEHAPLHTTARRPQSRAVTRAAPAGVRKRRRGFWQRVQQWLQRRQRRRRRPRARVSPATDRKEQQRAETASARAAVRTPPAAQKGEPRAERQVLIHGPTSDNASAAEERMEPCLPAVDKTSEPEEPLTSICKRLDRLEHRLNRMERAVQTQSSVKIHYLSGTEGHLPPALQRLLCEVNRLTQEHLDAKEQAWEECASNLRLALSDRDAKLRREQADCETGRQQVVELLATLDRLSLPLRQTVPGLEGNLRDRRQRIRELLDCLDRKSVEVGRAIRSRTPAPSSPPPRPRGGDKQSYWHDPKKRLSDKDADLVLEKVKTCYEAIFREYEEDLERRRAEILAPQPPAHTQVQDEVRRLYQEVVPSVVRLVNRVRAELRDPEATEQALSLARELVAATGFELIDPAPGTKLNPDLHVVDAREPTIGLERCNEIVSVLSIGLREPGGRAIEPARVKVYA